MTAAPARAREEARRLAMASRGLAAVAAGLALAGCLAARRAEPEIVGVDYETRVSGDGLVAVEGARSTLDEAELGPEEGAAAGSGEAADAGQAAAGLPASEAASGSTPPSSNPPSVAEEAELRLVGVRGASDAASTRLVFQLSRAPDAIHAFELQRPRRCVIDVDGPAAGEGARSIAAGDGLVREVRVGRHEGRIRLVADLVAEAAAPCRAELDGTAVRLAVGGIPAAEPALLWAAPDAPDGAAAHARWLLARALGAPAPVSEAEAGAETAPPPERLALADDGVDSGDPGEAAPVDAAAQTPGGQAEPRAAPEESVRSAAELASSPGSEAEPAGPKDAAEPGASVPPRHLASAPPAEPPAREEDPGAAPRRKRYTGEKISLEFKDADILNVLRAIADVSHRNIVATDDVKGRVTIVLYEVPWDQALDILLKSTGLEKVEYDDVITISTSKRLEEERKARLAARQAGRQLEPLQTAYLHVNYVKPRDLAALLRGQDSTSAAGAAAQAQIAGTAADSAGQRRGLLSSRGVVMVNDATSTIIVRDIADGIANARELVRRLDVQTAQVAIQGLIFEADANLARDLGIRWGAKYTASPETGNPTGRNFPGRVGIGGVGPGESDAAANAGSDSGGGSSGDGSSGGSALPILVDFPAAGIKPGAGSTLGILLGSLDGSTSIDAQITALEEAGKGKVISRPKVITLNNTEAQIQSLEILRVRLPSTGTVINTGAGGQAGGNSLATQEIDTGITLRVTPQVSSDGFVLLQMFVKSSVPSQQQTDDIPNELARQATSQVLVRDGETVVIGGVYRQRASHAEAGVPWLRNIPIFGWLFKNMSLQDVRQELLVFITPKVVWRNVREGALPSAEELWHQRDRSAYRIEPAEPAAAGAP